MASRRDLLKAVAMAAVPGVMSGISRGAKSVPSVTPQQFGARGVGMGFDDRPAIQRAIDNLWFRHGRGIVRFPRPPADYNLSGPLICRPGVSLIADSGTKMVNRVQQGFVERSIFLPGNFHPHFTQALIYNPIMSIDASRTELRLMRANFDLVPGDQVLIASRQRSKTGSWSVPAEAWLNAVHRRNGTSLLLEKSLPSGDASDYGIATLRSATGRNGIPLFFYADASIEGFELETSGHWVADSATHNVVFSNNEIYARSAIYGNAFQNTIWRGNTFNFMTACSEQAHNSIENTVVKNVFIRNEAAHGEHFVGFVFHENARKICVDNCSISVDRCSGRKSPLFMFQNCQNVTISRTSAKFGDMPGWTVIWFGDNAPKANIPLSGNIVDHCDIEFRCCARVIDARGGDNPSVTRNGVTNSLFKGRITTKPGVRLLGMKGGFNLTGTSWAQ